MELAPARPLPGVRAFELPDAGGSSSPGLAIGADELHLVWMSQAGAPTLMLAGLPQASALADNEWSEPQAVESNPRLLINWADVPAVGETAAGRVVVAWPEHHTDDPAVGYGLRVAAQLDDGSFAPAWSPDEVRTGRESGFTGFVATPAGLRMFWLDGRDLGHGHGAEGQGTMALRSVLIDDEGHQVGPSELLDGRTCECCKIGVGVVGDQAFAAYRDRSESEIRDIFVAGPGLAPRRVAEDGWKIAGCPVNGPAVASARDRAHVAWFTGADDRSVARVASGSPEAGFGRPARFDLGFPAGRIDLTATPDGGALISWFELEDGVPGRARLLTRRLGADGRLGDAFEVAEVGAARDWGFPRAAVVGDRVLWVFSDPAGDGGRPRLRGRVSALPGLGPTGS
ncbi:hypothetical protein ENSA5_21670 [Enhygromyxa salina]|uniref:Uncharacterized protein n=1 Tax=Enhygromyxa salina TaxID=215803 RepID=A0A2S9YBT7_9BACT|nr:hypothetical protein [Enhygromyxa salina]PRQ02522.1 hypothetical protein ENSA5_21670 [Enhygromyxa salina]